MKKKLISAILCTALAVSMLAGCGSSSSTTTSSTEETEEEAAEEETAEAEEETVETGEAKTIAYITPSTTTPFWNWVQDGIEAQAAEAGYTVQVYDSENDSATQLKNAQNAITAGVDAIIISPTDSASCPAVQEEAEAADIPVVICDIGTDEGTYLTMVSTPNYDGAYEVGEYLAQYLIENGMEGSVGEITIPLSRINGQNRDQGFQDALAEYGFEVTTVLEGPEQTMDEADQKARNIVTANPDLVAIFANYDQATLGTEAALEDLGLEGQVLIASFDGNPDIVEDLQSGKVLVCGAQQAKKMGKESVNALVSFFAGEEVDEEIFVPTLLLTADNVEDYLDVIEEDICGLD
ncbi:MAG: substrate-binding domain-containing protein [Lachnospiraceae bacterium]|nr:substrate-binding domain-containing protein [Lachnospiraceae bacterium]